MRKIILTSAGFENKAIEKIFLELAGKRPEDIKALFVPTAAISPNAVIVLKKCMEDLLNAGILKQNISVFDLHCGMPYDELRKYDTVYFCGGDTEYLLGRINDTDFNITIKQFVDNGGIYIGVSAGSIAAAQNLPDNLGLINCILGVHVQNGSKKGTIDQALCPHIDLTDSQAILINGDNCRIVE